MKIETNISSVVSAVAQCAEVITSNKNGTHELLSATAQTFEQMSKNFVGAKTISKIGIEIMSEIVKSYNAASMISYAQKLLESVKYDSVTIDNVNEIVDILSNVSINEDSVIIPKEIWENLSGNTKVVQEELESINEKTSDISFSYQSFFLEFLLPIICMILPMLQSHYYQMQSNVDANKMHAEESEYHQKMMELEEEEIEIEKQILAILSEIQEHPAVNPTPPAESSTSDLPLAEPEHTPCPSRPSPTSCPSTADSVDDIDRNEYTD